MSSQDEAPAASLTIAAAPPPAAPEQRPVVRPTSPHRYRVQYTIGQETQEKLRRLQALLRREIPDGDPGEIFDRALNLLLEKVEKAKWGGATSRAVPQPSIRSGTDTTIEPPAGGSRYRSRSVDRAAWQRDEGRCGFVRKSGIRCSERAFLEFHHMKPYAHGGPATVENISLRCRRHNQYEADLVFGPRPGPNSA
jgi:hypothetical protein